MKVGFDISQVAHPGGVASYTNNLAARLAKMPDLEMIFFYSSLRKPYKGKLKNVKKYSFPPTFFEYLFNKVRFSIDPFLGDIDLFHSSDWIQPKTKAKKITTYHDVVPIKFPKWSDPKIVSVHKKRLSLVEAEVDMVIAVSETTKKDLMEVSNIPSEKITVIYEGVDESFTKKNQADVEAFRQKYNLPKEFILAIGGSFERRNLDAITKASKDYELVISGKTIPFIPQEEMPLLYSSAKILLYPSLYEGFGLPILEAFACQLPVITSSLGAMKEIAKDSALLVDPSKISEIETQVKELMESGDLRNKLITKGLKRASDFSWDKAALETFNLYRKVTNM